MTLLTVAVLGLVLGAIVGGGLGMHLATRRVTRRAADMRVEAVEEAFARGRELGGDELADDMIRASLAAPDPIEVAWPAPAGVVRWRQ